MQHLPFGTLIRHLVLFFESVWAPQSIERNHWTLSIPTGLPIPEPCGAPVLPVREQPRHHQVHRQQELGVEQQPVTHPGPAGLDGPAPGARETIRPDATDEHYQWVVVFLLHLWFISTGRTVHIPMLEFGNIHDDLSFYLGNASCNFYTGWRQLCDFKWKCMMNCWYLSIRTFLLWDRHWNCKKLSRYNWILSLYGEGFF